MHPSNSRNSKLGLRSWRLPLSPSFCEISVSAFFLHLVFLCPPQSIVTKASCLLGLEYSKERVERWVLTFLPYWYHRDDLVLPFSGLGRGLKFTVFLRYFCGCFGESLPCKISCGDLSPAAPFCWGWQMP